MIPVSTLKRLLRESFAEEASTSSSQSYVNVDPTLRKAKLQQFKTTLESQTHVTCRHHQDRGDKDDTGHLTFKIDQGADERNGTDWFRLRFLDLENCNRLCLIDSNYRRRNRMEPVPVCHIDQVVAFVLSVQQQQDRRFLRVKKSEKVATFQQLGLAAKLAELGEQHRFAFAIGQNARDVLLSIRVKGRKTGFHFSFPKGKLEAVIEQVPQMIADLERLSTLGVSFRTDNKKWDGRQGPWSEPSLTTDPSDINYSEVEEHACK
ncbi:MAG: hypothetical protein ABL921_13420 [Pirellula sp.]